MRKTKAGKELKIQLSCNPSHLEAVDPVVEGMARARQDELRDGEQKPARRLTIIFCRCCCTATRPLPARAS